MENYTIFASFGLFVVWMQRHHRWSMMLKAMTNKYTVVGSRRAATQAVASSSSGSPSSSHGPTTQPTTAAGGYSTIRRQVTVPPTKQVPTTASGGYSTLRRKVTVPPTKRPHPGFWTKVAQDLTHPVLPGLKTLFKGL